MKIRIISDLHVDVNSRYPLKKYPSKDDIFTIVAGDTSGSPDKSIEWIRNNVSSGLVISGNHLVYNEKYLPIQALREEMAKAFPIDSDISYLDVLTGNFTKKVNGILFLGSTLYFDGFLRSNFNPSGFQENNIRMAERTLNDFSWGYIETKPFHSITARHYVDWCSKTIDAFEKVLKENEAGENLPVVVITHFCPSTKFIASQYEFSENNCAYVSDLEWFIENHPSIKAWVCGHIHSRIFTEYYRDNGSSCKLLSNPRGYCGFWEDHGWSPNVFLNTDDWTIEKN